MNKRGDIEDFMGIAAILFTLFICLLVVGLIAYSMIYAITTGEETITIKDKWEKYSGGDAKYLLSTTNGQVFQITDTVVKWRFDSSNLYARIDVGDTCKIQTQGWRFPLLSDYKNILEASC